MHKTSYRPDVDGLRALAVSAVVGYHVSSVLVPGGFVGVDVFFVISGYLITSILATELDEGRFSIVRFYLRRVRRLFPALVVVLATTMAIGAFVLLPDEFERLAMHVIAGAGFLSNVLNLNEAGYFDPAAETKPLLHLWSLGVEEQFYLAWPLLLAVAWAWRTRRVAALLAFAAVASFVACVIASRAAPDAAFYLPQYRFWEFAVGGLLALLDRRTAEGAPGRGIVARLRGSTGPATLVSLAGCTMVLVAFASARQPGSFPGPDALLPVLGTALMIFAGPASWLNRAVLSMRPAVWLGRISYPLYLWHWPLLSFATILAADNPSKLSKVALVGGSVLLADATYRFVERPFRFPRHAPARDWRWLPAASLAACGVALAVWLAGGFPGRTYFAVDPFYWGDARFRNDACVAAYRGPYDYCMLAPGGAPTAMLIGDSHANHYYPGLAKSLRARGDVLLHLGGGGCVPSEGVDSHDARERPGKCPGMIGSAIAHALADPRIRHVYLAGRFSLYFEGEGFGAAPGEAGKRWVIRSMIGVLDAQAIAAPQVALDVALERTVRRLIEAGKRVTVMMQVPEFAFDPKNCVRVRPVDAFRDVRASCRMELSQLNVRQGPSRERLQGLAARVPGLELFDPHGVLCSEGVCNVLDLERRVLYRDSHHLTEHGSFAVQGLAD
jgi:peptidoglycan/LPS O-acetylase OafA/YrhL